MAKSLNEQKKAEIIQILKLRFEKSPLRHKDLKWNKIQLKLENQPEKCICRQIQRQKIWSGIYMQLAVSGEKFLSKTIH